MHTGSKLRWLWYLGLLFKKGDILVADIDGPLDFDSILIYNLGTIGLPVFDSFPFNYGSFRLSTAYG